MLEGAWHQLMSQLMRIKTPQPNCVFDPGAGCSALPPLLSRYFPFTPKGQIRVISLAYVLHKKCPAPAPVVAKGIFEYKHSNLPFIS